MMRVLTVRQPWASLIVLGHKPIENRTWGTTFRGDVAILSAKNIDTGERASAAFRTHLPKWGPKINALPTGGVIGVAELCDIIRESDSWWFTGPVGLVFRNPRVLKSKDGGTADCILPMPGSLSMFNAHPRDEEIIRAHL